MVELAYSESSLGCFIISVTQLKAASLDVLTLKAHYITKPIGLQKTPLIRSEARLAGLPSVQLMRVVPPCSLVGAQISFYHIT